MKQAFLTFQHGDRLLGTLHLELYNDTVPATVHNFASLCNDGSYISSLVHRLIPGFMLQAGDYTNHDGTGGRTAAGTSCLPDENFVHRHDRPGVLSMANAGPNTATSQFFITFRATPHLDQKHVVFGHVNLAKSQDVLRALERVKTGDQDRPLQDLRIVACGTVTDDVGGNDEDEIDLDEPEEENVVDDVDEKGENNPAKEVVEEEEEEEDDLSLSKTEAMKRRLRLLKQKMNQARQLNKIAVKHEGERSTVEGRAREKKKQTAATRKAKAAAWEGQNAKALATASMSGVDAKAVAEQAADSVYKATVRAEKEEMNRYSVNDYHNPEGQHRNYHRNIKSLPPPSTTTTTATYNPLDTTADPERERQGARRLAEEMHRRIEKKQQREMKRKAREVDDGEVSYINERNKRFNEKINRTYDKQTREIRENLERGTAL